MATPSIDPNAVLEGVRLKIARAWGVLEPLLNDVERVLEAGSSGRPRRNADGTWSLFFVPEEMPSPVWGTRLGDFAHNCRSALDNTVTALVACNGALPTNDNAFPVCLKRSDWRRRVERDYPSGGLLANVRSEDYAAIESVQPFQGINPSRDPSGAAKKPLAVLTRINNADKHSALHAAVAYQAPVAQELLGVDPPTPVEIVWSPEPFSHLEYGAEMTRIRFLARVPPGFQVAVNWPLAVRFTDYLGRTVRTGELLGIHHAVVQVVGHWDEDMRRIADGTYSEARDRQP